MHEPRRLRSHAFSIGMVGVLALALSGCGRTNQNQNQVRRCVDQETQQVVEDGRCPDNTSGGSSGRYRSYYGGRVSNGRASGGSYTAPSGVESGGFGSRGSTGSGS